MSDTRAFTGNRYRSFEALDQWLRGSREAPEEPYLAIVDAHHHLSPDGDHRYELSDLIAQGDGMNVVGSVFVECSAAYEATVRYGASFDPSDPALELPVAETRFVAAAADAAPMASRHGLCAAIVGFVDLQSGEEGARRLLEAHIEAGKGRFRGTRQSAAWEGSLDGLNWRSPPPGLLLSDAFQSGFGALAPLGLSFDAWLWYPQLLDLTLLARRFPDTRIILNHFGGMIGVGPYQQWHAEGFALWRTYVTELARYPNVIMKMGGLSMPAAGFGFHFEDSPPNSTVLAARWKPIIEFAIDTFGPDRCMIGSNFPVDRQSAEYSTLWNAYKIATRQYSTEERAAIFSGTAQQAYSISNILAASSSAHKAHAANENLEA